MGKRYGERDLLEENVRGCRLLGLALVLMVLGSGFSGFGC